MVLVGFGYVRIDSVRYNFILKLTKIRYITLHSLHYVTLHYIDYIEIRDFVIGKISIFTGKLKKKILEIIF